MYDINLTMGFIGILISAAGVFISLWIMRSPRPLYVMRLAKLGGIRHPDIAILVGERKVSNLYSVRLVFWNGGRKDIRKEDLPEPKAGPMIRVSKKSEVLRYIAATTTGDKSGDFISCDNDLSINFNYLNQGDAFLGEVYLTSEDDVRPEINFSGCLKGYSISEGDIHNISTFNHLFFILTGTVLLFLTLSFGYSMYSAITLGHGTAIIVSSLFFIFSLWLTVLDFRFNIFSILKKIPKQYLEFLETGEMKHGT